jgi:hypothetical protein
MMAVAENQPMYSMKDDKYYQEMGQPVYAGGRGGRVNSKGPFSGNKFNEMEQPVYAMEQQPMNAMGFNDMDKMKTAPYEQMGQAMGREDINNTKYMTYDEQMAYKKEQADLRYADGPALTNDQLAQLQRAAGKKVEITRDPALGQRINQMAIAPASYNQMQMGGTIEIAGQAPPAPVVAPPAPVVAPPAPVVAPPAPVVTSSAPEDSSMMMWIGISVGVVVLIALIAFFVMRNNAIKKNIYQNMS